jgi:hypothetical protein
MSGPKSVGHGGTHTPPVHSTNHTTDRAKSNTSTPARTATSQPRPNRASTNERPSDLVAARHGTDVSLLRARIDAKLPVAVVAARTGATPAPTSRAAKTDPLNQRLPTNGDPLRRRSVNPDRNRAVNPDRVEFGPNGKLTSKSFYFPIEKGTRMVDGRGNDRGEVKAGSVKLNYGQQKQINGEDYVYAFATKAEKNGLTRSVSGWILKSSLKGDLETRINMPTVNAPRPSGDQGPHREFAITGGDRKAFGDLKVVPNSTKKNERASDYLSRGGGTNLLYNLPGKGGVSTDTLPRGATFHRSNSVRARAVNLYKPGSSEPVQKKMLFVYGFVKDPTTNERRYGWIAAKALGKQLKA